MVITHLQVAGLTTLGELQLMTGQPQVLVKLSRVWLDLHPQLQVVELRTWVAGQIRVVQQHLHSEELQNWLLGQVVLVQTILQAELARTAIWRTSRLMSK